MIRVGIVGCGKIADAHADQIQRIPDCRIAGVCDREKLMAKQLYERFPVEGYFDDVNRMIDAARPDVVHITTPPQSHFELGKVCLESGCHVYIEKPFTLNTEDATELLRIAESRNLKITVGHDDQFSHAARRMRALIREGYLGGPPVHMESYYCYDLGSEGYAKALLGDRKHWVRKLPGKLLHNIISHGIARISELLTTENPEIIAHGFTSNFLKSIGETEIIDELRVIISEPRGATAYFTFSSQMRPSLHHFRVYGPKNALILDNDHQTLIKMSGERYKSYLEKFVTPLVLAKQYAGNSLYNVKQFMRNDFHMKSGMKFLIEEFYRSIAEDAPLPIPYREIIRSSRIMDGIFTQIYPHEMVRPQLG